MTCPDDKDDLLVPLAEAERRLRAEGGMSRRQVRHLLAEHVRGGEGIPWVATPTAVGVMRPVLEEMLARPKTELPKETPE